MTYTTAAAKPLWLRIVQFPLVRIVVLGGGLLSLMAWTEFRILDVKDSPVLGAAIALGMGLVAMAVYVAYARIVERRESTELALQGAGRDFAIGALIGAGLYTACAVILMVLGIFKVEGLNPLAFLLPAVAMAVKSAIFEELVFRGVLQGQLLRLTSARRIGLLTVANLCTTAGFVAMHLPNQPPLWALAVALPSLLFGHLRDHFGSVLPAVMLHAYYNAGFALTAWWVHR